MSEQLPPSSVHEDEIDLRELVSILVDGWYWIVGSVVLCLLIGLAVVVTREDQWETEFEAVTAGAGQFAGLDSLPGVSIGENRALRRLTNELGSFRNFREFVAAEPDWLDLPEDADLAGHFETAFNIERTEDDSLHRLSVMYRYSGNVDGPALVNRYVAWTAEKLWQEYIDDIRRNAETSLNQLERQLALEEDALQNRRQERIFALDQAIQIARELNIDLPTTPQQYGRTAPSGDVLYANISGDESSLPLYFLGYEALEAERATLQDQLSQGLTNDEIRALASERESVQRVLASIEDGSVDALVGFGELPYPERWVEVVDPAYQPASTTGTSGLLIMAAAGVLGGFLGLVLTFVVHFVGSLREYRKSRQTAGGAG